MDHQHQQQQDRSFSGAASGGADHSEEGESDDEFLPMDWSSSASPTTTRQQLAVVASNNNNDNNDNKNNRPLRRRRANAPSQSWFGVGGGGGGGRRRSSSSSSVTGGRGKLLQGGTTTTTRNSSSNRGHTSSSNRDVSSYWFNVSIIHGMIHHAMTEKITIGVLLLIAWGWIMVTIGMVSYRHPNSQQHLSIPDTTTTHRVEDDSTEENNNEPPESGVQIIKNHPNVSSLLGHGASPLLIFTYRRADYLRKTLQYVLDYIPHDCESVGCPVIVSQDGSDANVAQVVLDYIPQFQSIGIPLWHWQHEQASTTALLERLPPSLLGINNVQGYAALAQHYQWALDRVFYPKTSGDDQDENNSNSHNEPIVRDEGGHRGDTMKEKGAKAAAAAAATITTVHPKRVILLEEDLQIAPDFFSYFAALAPLLDQDETLLAISAYNDNGLRDKVQNVTRLLRSDFFPGLGWMMTQRLWTQEFSPLRLLQHQGQQQDQSSSSWPLVFWDDWLREPAQRRGRHVIRPEVSRTWHFGNQGGTSNNQFGQSLQDIALNSIPVDWNQQNLSYLQSEQSFDTVYWQLITSAQTVPNVDDLFHRLDTAAAESNEIMEPPTNKKNKQTTTMVFRLEYRNQQPEFEFLARKLGLFTDEKAGIPRTAYKGVVETRWNPHRAGSSGSDDDDDEQPFPMILLTPPMSQLQHDFASVASTSVDRS